MPTGPPIPTLEQNRRSILAELFAIGDMRPGSLVHRYMKCSTPTCRCWQEGDPGHGPYFLLVRNLDGKRTSRSLPSAAATTVQSQLDEYQRFRRLTAELVDVCEQLADARLPQAGTDTRNEAKKACTQEFALAIEAELARFVAPGAADAVDFEALETRLRQRALELAARAVAWRCNADRSDHGGPALACPCGQPARYAGRRAKTFETVLGGLTLQRAYSHCSACGQGFFPRDRALGMARTDLSPGVTRLTGSAAALVSFAQASGLLDELAGVRVGTKHVQRTAEALGRQLAALARQAPPAPAPPPAPTAYLGVDGTGGPVRASETAGRPGKQPDGSVRIRPAHASRGRATGLREAERRGFPLARRRVILGAGASWIWRIASEDYPGAIQIVDLWPAKEQLWAAHAPDLALDNCRVVVACLKHARPTLHCGDPLALRGRGDPAGAADAGWRHQPERVRPAGVPGVRFRGQSRPAAGGELPEGLAQPAQRGTHRFAGPAPLPTAPARPAGPATASSSAYGGGGRRAQVDPGDESATAADLERTGRQRAPAGSRAARRCPSALPD